VTAFYDELLPALRAAYDGKADFRDQLAKSDWKLAERAAFGARVQEGQRLLEVGAGTGQDSEYFASLGLDVIATDLSPAMVEHCRAKGLDARVMDVLGLSFPDASFDAVYTVNCLLHVPNADLPAALAAIHGVLRPGGLCYVGMYGGDGTEGPLADDQHDPPRFFSWRTLEQLRGYVDPLFSIVDAHTVETPWEGNFHSLTLTPG
jgi:SAM-dependent methyltransferase